MLAPWKKSYHQPRQHIKKQRDYFANKGPSSQSYGFSSSQVWMWKLDYKKADTWQNQYNSVKFKNKIKLNKIKKKKSWVQKNWCFSTVVLEKTPESPLDCKEI